MSLLLENLYAYRFFEKGKGPLDTIRKYNIDEIDEMGKMSGIAHIREIYHNRVNMEKLMFTIFKRNGGKPKNSFPLYFAIYDELPESNTLHIRFKEPMCIKIPMKEFCKSAVSFTYGLSTHAFTRKDNHPCRRKLLSWNEAQEVINKIPFDKKEDLWLEMQVWDENIINEYYMSHQDCIWQVKVEGKLSDEDKRRLCQKYNPYLQSISKDYFFEPSGLHGVMHSIRVLILSQKLAEINKLNEIDREVLKYCALYHDIGRVNNVSDMEHGYLSFNKMIEKKILPKEFDLENIQIIQFVIENHPYNVDVAQEAILKYQIKDREHALKLFCVFRDADILDLCRYGSVNKHFLHYISSRDVVPFAFQLLLIYRERSNDE